MKTKKRAAERMHSLTASFLSFSPDAQHPAGGVSHRPARGAAVPQPIRKYTIFICESMCACCSVSPGNCYFDINCCFRKMGAGTMSLLGCGVKPRRSPQAPPGKCLRENKKARLSIRNSRAFHEAGINTSACGQLQPSSCASRWAFRSVHACELQPAHQHVRTDA